ncbi:MAG: rRNA maturation RNase YbeY [Bdellovibrionales bacterium]
MNSIIINKAKLEDLPETFLTEWVDSIALELKDRGIDFPESAEEMVLAFVDLESMKDLNHRFRSKNRPTDVLSFASMEETSLGELVFCIEVISENAKDHGLSFNEELGYMCLHGILHLLGFEHESSEEEAKEMFDLQDEIFRKLSKEFF